MRNAAWFHPGQKAWLRASAADGQWRGWCVESMAEVRLDAWTPWELLFDDHDPPFYRWFAGGLTNAAFSEVDWHVLEGRGDQLAYIEEPDPSVEGDAQSQITRGQLLVRSAAAARLLRCDYGLAVGDRVLFFLPMGIEQIVWVEACKRLGVVYCCCSPSLPPQQIADRIAALRARLVITAEHPDWSHLVHKALNRFAPASSVINHAPKVLGISREELITRSANRLCLSLDELPFAGSEEPLGSIQEAAWSGVKVLVLGAVRVPKTELRARTPQTNKQTKQKWSMSNAHQERSLLHSIHCILGAVRVPKNELQARIPTPQKRVETRTLPALELPEGSLRGLEDVAATWKQYGSPVPVEANHPLFVIFTSGTTGRPKGICHAHGYIVGLVETMRVVFDADPASDRMLTVGGMGWITGQSYQIAAVLASGVTSVLMRGSPVKPCPSRFARVIQKHKVTIFKAGSSFLREVMSTPRGMQEVQATAMNTLRIATFCAEPLSEAVQAFAMSAICKMYINSYWSTEHGGITWSRRYNDPGQPLKPDTHCWPLPWVDAEVWVFSDPACPAKASGAWQARPAKVGERGEVVCTSPLPCMLRCVWGDVDNFGKEGWAGDRTAMLARYWRSTEVPGRGTLWIYAQGDFAARHADGAYTFHGRSDEVLNVSGILFGTEHIEGAILRDKQCRPDSPLGHCVVVGYQDNISGEVPLAFLTGSDAANPPGSKDFMRLFCLVREAVGPVPLKFIVVSALPQTFNGKFMRRLLSAVVHRQSLGDLSTLSNPECIPKLQEEFECWKREVEGRGKLR